MSTAADPVPMGESPPIGARPWWVHALRLLALVVVAGIVVAVLRDKLPSAAQVSAALESANWWWVTAAFGLQLASIGMLIRQQRRLLRAFGVRIKLRTVAAITYSSNAISLTLPAGSAVGAGFSYQQYRRSGAGKKTAATVLVLSGLLSVAGLVVLYLIGFAVAAGLRLLQFGATHPPAIALTGLAVLALVAAVGSMRGWADHRVPRQARHGERLRSWSARHPRTGPFVDQVLDTGRQARQVDRRDWRLALATSAGNWLFDTASLYASCLAFGIRINVFELAVIYIGIQLVRQIPLTPGGIGVIEASLLAALVAAGAANGPASAAVLVYRLLSAWLLVPIGYLMMALLRRARRTAVAVPSSGSPGGRPD